MGQMAPEDRGSPQIEKPSPSRKRSLSPPEGTSPFTLWLIRLVAVAALIATLLLGVYAWQESSIQVFAVGAFMALATTGIASAVGFLFGLPRYSDSVGPAGSRATVAAEARALGLYVPSNNLEQVSDWLTKLLLGAGLVQLGRVGRWLDGLIEELAGALAGPGANPIPSTAKVLAASLLAFYSALGFLSGYIVTSLWYRRRLQETMRHIYLEAVITEEESHRRMDSSSLE